MEERIQKILAQAGVASRRASEELIVSGRVRVNGAVAELGQKADPAKDKLTVDGRLIKPPEQKIYIALHKPRYVLSTVEPEQGDTRQTVRDLIPVSERLYPVGRLDFDSEGLILMTNDGDLAQKLTHPSNGHTKIYRVLVARQPDQDQLATWRRGVVLEDGYKTQPAEVRVERLFGKGAWLRIEMREGRKRQIRETGSLLGVPVVRILRISIGSLHLGTLKVGEWRYLTQEEIAALKLDEAKKPLAKPRREFRPKTVAPVKRGPTAPPKPGEKPRRENRPVNEEKHRAKKSR